MKRQMAAPTAAFFSFASLAAISLLVTENKTKPISTVSQANQITRLDLSGYAATAPQQPLSLLFIHHSCGGQLLAPAGPNDGTSCIYKSHPNGGGLRARLEQASYVVHEASYKSQVGDKTDIFDWPAKFRGQMDQILSCDFQDTPYSNGQRNQVVMFKSCFPNNDFKSTGTVPGNATGPDLTVSNAKASYMTLLAEFQKQPQVLFVCVTAPPLAPKAAPQPAWKQLAKKMLGREISLAEKGRMAREFNNWLAGTDGWLKDYRSNNVVVFDYYNLLTDNGASDLLCYPTGEGFDSHPSRAGNEKAAEALVPFLNKAVKRAGLSA
jgi:hypothetical protein